MDNKFVFDRSLAYDPTLKERISKDEWKQYSRIHANRRYRKKQTKTYCKKCSVFVSPNCRHIHNKTHKHFLKSVIYDLMIEVEAKTYSNADL
jgi:hypothetical protein